MGKVVGLDFGTTNSAIAVATPDGEAALATFSEDGQRTATFRSVLYFDAENLRLFAQRFGAARLRGGGELTTVARGLALRALANC